MPAVGNLPRCFCYYAMFANPHMYEFGTTREQLPEVAIKSHHYSALNPNALFRKEITME